MTLDLTYQFGFPRCLLGFLLGMLTYKAYRARIGERLLQFKLALMLLTSLVALSAQCPMPDASTVLIFPGLVLASAYGSSAFSTDTKLGRLQTRLGDCSYALYITHIPILVTMLEVVPLLFEIERWTATTIRSFYVVYVFIAILTAAFVHHTVEVRARRTIRRLVGA